MIGISGYEFRLFQGYIRDRCGIEISDEKAYLIESRLTKLLIDAGYSSFEELYRGIYDSDDEELPQRLIEAITTNETLWFRDKSPWRIIEDLCMPAFLEKLRSGERDRIRIWSAAASTGQEAYSTAICIDRYLRERMIKDIGLGQFEIIGTDISRLTLKIAENGRYDNISIARGLDPLTRDRYFTERASSWEIIDEIKHAVTFRQFNLQNSFIPLGNFDVIFCRYVLIYFSDSLRNDIFNKIYGILNKNGVLFIGAYELYENMSARFHSRLYENSAYYQGRSPWTR